TLSRADIKVVNYLTDDPWNRAHWAPWFLKALPHYFAVFSPRHANVYDLEKLGCQHVSYLPFGYDPELHFPEEAAPDERKSLEVDLLFVGGADKDRVPICEAIAQS